METATADREEITIEPTAPPKPSLVSLIKCLTNDVKTFLRQELNLAKAELTEKVSWLGRNAIMLAAGGFVAYAGLIVFLVGLGWLLAWVFQKAGMQPLLAGFVGLAIVGLVVAALGAAFVFKGLKVLSSDSLAPKRTIHTIQRLKGADTQTAAAKESTRQPLPSSEEMQARVEQTENRMGQTLEELGRRLSPHEINARMKARIIRKPYRSGLVAVGVGLVSGLFIARDSRRG